MLRHLFALLLFSSSAIAADAPPIPRISPQELQEALAAGTAVAADVRGRVPWKYGHIEDAVWTPLGRVEEYALTIPKDKLVVTYCSCDAEQLSLRAAERLRAAGFTKVAALVGGYDAWLAAGLPIATGELESDAPPQVAGGRLIPPSGLPCGDDDVTVYPGEVIRYSRRGSRVSVTIRTDHGTTEKVTVRGTPERSFLIFRAPFGRDGWSRIEQKRGSVFPGMRVHAWVCRGGKAILDWRPGEAKPAE